MRGHARSAIAWSMLSFWLTGCGAPSVSNQGPDPSTRQLQMVGALYGQFMSEHAGAAPANEAQFIASLEQHSGGWKKLVATPQELLTSPRDRQPLAIAYGAAPRNASPAGFPWVAHEASGVDGQIMVIDAHGYSELKSLQDAAQLLKK